MIEILSILLTLDLPMEFTLVNQLSKIISGVYSISNGGVTQKNISRQTVDMGMGYRSVQRFFGQQINWSLMYLSILTYVFPNYRDRVFLLALDEVVEKKSGKQTHLVGRFYSSIVGKAIRSVCFHACSLVEVESGKSMVLSYEQREAPAKSVSKKQGSKKNKGNQGSSKKRKKKGRGRKVGRPPGSKNKLQTKEHTGLSRSFERLVELVLPLLSGIGIIPAYVVADGAYASKTYILILLGLKQPIDLISKLRVNSALYVPYQPTKEDKKRRGRKRKYGAKIDYEQLSPSSDYYVTTIEREEHPQVKIELYQISEVWTKFLPCKINVVILKAINTESGKVGRRVLFSTDLSLSAKLMVQYYALRFKIEFNFRDAKQYFGLADFRAYKERQVNNSVGLAFFLVNFSEIIRKKVTEEFQLQAVSILDVKALFNAEKHYDRLLKLSEIELCEFKKKDLVFDLAKADAPNLADAVAQLA